MSKYPVRVCSIIILLILLATSNLALSQLAEEVGTEETQFQELGNFREFGRLSGQEQRQGDAILRRNTSRLPFQVSLYLSGNYTTDISFLMGGGSWNINRGQYSWQNSLNYQVSWVESGFGNRFNQRRLMSPGVDSKVGLQIPVGRPDRSNQLNQNQRPGQLPMVLNSSENIANRVSRFLNGETRLDYRLSQKMFLFGLSSLRVDTRSNNRLFLGSGAGTNLSHDLSLDVGIGLTRLFETGQDQRLIEEESLLGKRVLSALSNIQYQRPISRNISIHLNGRGYWYIQQQAFSGLLNLGTSIRLYGQFSLNPYTTLEYLGIEQTSDPFQYQVQIRLSYAFPTGRQRARGEQNQKQLQRRF